jgi:hypothetical protein
MADYKVLNDGLDWLLTNSLAGTPVKYALSTFTADEIVATDKLIAAKMPGEITGTLYEQQAEAEANEPVATQIVSDQHEWKTGAAVNWPAAVKSCGLIAGGVLIAVRNLQTNGVARDMSGANTTEKFTFTLDLS